MSADDLMNRIEQARNSLDSARQLVSEAQEILGIRDEPPPQEPEERGFFDKALGAISDHAHTALDLAGFLPVVGTAADLTNAALYAAEGDYKNAAFSAASAIPVAGDAAAAARLGDRAMDAAQGIRRGADAVDTAEGVAEGVEQVEQGNYGNAAAALGSAAFGAGGGRGRDSDGGDGSSGGSGNGGSGSSGSGSDGELETRGYHPDPGERTTTQEEWKEQYGEQRAAERVQQLDGHGYERHGSHVTTQQHTDRVQHGTFPNGQQFYPDGTQIKPVSQSSSFYNDRLHLEADGRAREQFGHPSTFAVNSSGEVEELPRRGDVIVSGSSNGYGEGVEVQRDSNGNPLPNRPVQSTGVQPNARVGFNYDSERGEWVTATHHPTSREVTP